MANSRKKELALDTNILLDIAKGREVALDFRELFQSRGFELVLTSTALIELNALRKNGEVAEKELATEALARIPEWNIRMFHLNDEQYDRTVRFRERLSVLGLIPDEEWNDGILIAEAAIAEIPLLITSDKHLLDIDEEKLIIALAEANLSIVHPVHPKRLARALF